jgi:CDGSH-type Zn-finger protein
MSDAPEPHIAIAENGPYLVTGGPALTRRAQAESTHGEPLDWDLVGADGVDYETAERFALCRCGQSENMPFCDGTHQKVGFDGKLTADRGQSADRREIFVGEGIVMTDDPTVCAHAGFCGTRYSNVWKMINATDDPEIRERLKRMVVNCPAGRLQFAPRDGGEAVEPEYKPSIATITDGPLWVRGGIEVQAPDGFAYEVRNRMTLCRCGQSKNKPFCDGAHEETGFRAS